MAALPWAPLALSRRSGEVREDAGIRDAMPHLDANLSQSESEQEASRLAALISAGILDTAPEPAYDTITRMAAEFFHADLALLGFFDGPRVWIKSSWGETIQELPRKPSFLELILESDGPVIIPDIALHPRLQLRRKIVPRFEAAGFAGVPIRANDGHVLGVLSILNRHPLPAIPGDEIAMLEGLADLAANHLELKRLRRTISRPEARKPRGTPVSSGAAAWPRSADLRGALERKEFVLHYQPEIDLATRRIVGVEALIRWQHPERGLIPPMEFIPKAEACGLILPIGEWGLAEACQQIEIWNREDPRNVSLRVCVNLSASQFSRKGLASHVASLIARSGVGSRQLGLEMTESSLIPNMHTAQDVLSALHQLGVCLLMDDFGTGYSSLNQLHSFPFDMLKIDRSFIGRMTDGDQPRQIVRTIIELARALRMDVVAEGIETREQYRMLRQMGCQFGQGYLFAQALPAKEISRLLRFPGRVLPDFDEAVALAAI